MKSINLVKLKKKKKDTRFVAVSQGRPVDSVSSVARDF